MWPSATSCSLNVRCDGGLDLFFDSGLAMHCPYCQAETTVDTNGDCCGCYRNLVEVEKDPNEKIWFFCVPCEKYFKTCRDGTGFDQAPCPECGDLSNTPRFHKGERNRNDDAGAIAMVVVLQCIFALLAVLFSSGLLAALLRRLF